MKKLLFLLLVAITPLLGKSQDGLFAELMRTSDKMFVVVIVLLIIFFGIIFFLTLLDKRVKNLEDKLNQ